MVDESSSSERGRFRRALLTGVAVIVPSVITLAVLGFVFNAIYDYLDVFSSVIVPFSPRLSLPIVGAISREVAIEVATPVVFLGTILLLGVVVDSTRYGERAVDYTDYAIEQIPGVGSVYQGFRQMSDAMLESDGGNFQEVVLVEFPTEGTYTLAFVTSETPDAIVTPTDAGEMRTLFMPMAPNPVMGGHVVFVPESRIVEVELTVDEGIRALVTSGVALESVTADVDGVPVAEIRDASPRNRIDSHLARNAGRTGADGTDLEETEPDGTDLEETEPSVDGPDGGGSDGSSGSSGSNRRAGGGS